MNASKSGWIAPFSGPWNTDQNKETSDNTQSPWAWLNKNIPDEALWSQVCFVAEFRQDAMTSDVSWRHAMDAGQCLNPESKVRGGSAARHVPGFPRSGKPLLVPASPGL